VASTDHRLPATNHRLSMSIVAGDYRRAQLSFNSAVDLSQTICVRDRNRIANSLRVGSPVTYDRDALNAQQRSPAVFSIVQALFEFLKRGPGQHSPGFCLDGRLKLMFQEAHYKFEDALAHRESDVSGEAIADNNVHLTGVHVAAFNVPNEVER
jgi:hypothetical protein